MHTIGFGRAVAHDIEAKFAFGRFGAHKYVALRRTVAFGVELEMVDQGFHTARYLPLGRWRDLGIADAVRACWHTIEGLVDDAQALLHLQHTYQVAIIDIAIGTNWYIEIKLFVAAIGKGFANVPHDVAPAQDRTARAIGDGILRAQQADAFGALKPELVVGEQIMVFAQAIREDA